MLHLQERRSLSGDEGEAGNSGVVIEEQALARQSSFCSISSESIRRLSLDSDCDRAQMASERESG